MKFSRLLAAAAATLIITGTANAASVCSHKTGKCAQGILSSVAGRFQSFADDLERHGATIYYLGGWRRGPCSPRHQHSCGLAIDFCQDWYGHVSGLKDCHLPRPAEFHRLARAHGLYDGSCWRHSDYGHVQAKESGGCKVAAHGSWGHGELGRRHRSTRTYSARRHRHSAQVAETHFRDFAPR